MSMCGRCGENEATMEFGGLPAHGGGVPYCERCAVEEQIPHAEERAAALPGLRQRLEELGGPAARVICGYSSWHYTDQVWPMGQLCGLERGHEGHHEALAGDGHKPLRATLRAVAAKEGVGVSEEGQE